MKKLIKISDTHYIVVDNSLEFNENHYYYDFLQKTIRQGSNNHVTGGYKQKITHSTRPIESCNCQSIGYNVKPNDSCAERNRCFDKIKSLSLTEVEEAIYGYSVEKMAKKDYQQYNLSPHDGDGSKQNYYDCFTRGFKAHRELTKGKFLLTKEQLEDALFNVLNHSSSECCVTQTKDSIVRSVMQSLLPKTEWDIEFDEQGKIKVI